LRNGRSIVSGLGELIFGVFIGININGVVLIQGEDRGWPRITSTRASARRLRDLRQQRPVLPRLHLGSTLIGLFNAAVCRWAH